MKNFRTLNLATDFYRDIQKLKIRSSVMRNQFERCSLSVVLNLAEGVGRGTTKDRRRFYRIAMGSLRETQVILMLIGAHETYDQSDKLVAFLYKLIQNPGGSS